MTANIPSLRTGNLANPTPSHNAPTANPTMTIGVPGEYTLPGIMKYLQSEWQRNERDRIQWELERAEMKARIARLEGENRASHLLVNEHLKQIRILESALNGPSSTISTTEVTGDNDDKEEASANNLDIHAISDNLLADEIEKARVELSHLSTEPNKLDLTPILESRDYLKRCLEEVSYLLQSGLSEDEEDDHGEAEVSLDSMEG